ncbi:methylthioribose-1-phosphate isomerase [Cryptosporangium aurantiacum]|uniref:Methylthioribose-1-phosphate isomerase n=1 Tax=Cryptosporangium aurantiacum TaxID=134849 RepID=A0A1M7ME06_9ACTN|nr:methylthioribose-1-phosphate isomerase [Cryptosporangium aurantiacum]SHM89065.1 methylthioribose-1-phosphate isomerase [Cryptosporangium aurantiacum]
MRPVLDDSVRLTDEGVRILDRRVFPGRQEWVLARSAGEVATAIRGMVTQSSGPFYAGLAGLRLSARLHRGGPLATALTALADDGQLLTAARPTNNHVRDAVREVLAAVAAAGPGTPEELAELVEAETARLEAAYRGGSAELGRLTAGLLPDGARVLTHCWMDAYLIGLVQEASRAGRQYEWVVTETRPYLQGARLTAHTLAEMGQSLTLVTDSTAAAVLAGQSALGRVDALVTAADRVTMDGHVINKVGTLAHAVAATAFDVPFFALVLAPDPTAATASDVVIEERDGAEVLSTLGERTASPLVERGYYPAFDVTPPRFVRRIVTDRGVFEPTRVGEYHSISKELA